MIDAWPRDHHRYTPWYNILNETYVKARYSKHFEVTEEALGGCSSERSSSTGLSRRFVRSVVQNWSRQALPTGDQTCNKKVGRGELILTVSLGPENPASVFMVRDLTIPTC
ncbi:hypothetical protein SAMN02927900_06373 [Rhizobium mongolense subsp. loessense]|uniref:Uncharacterized protein n=1 Tax=Rhizobium mongolense subsp. loessense TaxID=158890 RepID=A0A1G4U8Y4_9HYPH|nr:hypothetical protein SAMN02927900_06373 [Rhizobium mongolense subsp. loessense]